MQRSASPGNGHKEPFYFSKWLTFSAAAMLQLSAGLGYTFSIYSNALKTHFKYSQTQIAGIGTACNVGGYFALFAGLFFDKLKHYDRLGPIATIWIGCVVQFCGYAGMYVAATRHLPVSYPVMLFLAFTACNSQTWYETAGLVTSTRNFETERGTVIGILKAFLGLSASAYITIYVSFLEPDALRFLLLLAIAPTAVALLASPFINYVPFIQIEPHTKSHAFHMAFTAVIALAFYQTVIAIARNESTSLGFWTGVLMTAAVGVLIMPILAIPFIFGGIAAKPLALESKKALDVRKGPMPTIASQQDLSEPLLRQASRSATDVMPDGEALDHTPWQCLQSADFWLLWIANGIASGAGLTLLNNLGQQVLALGDGSSSQAVFVSLFSVANCLGRLLAGFMPDKLMRQHAVPRTASLFGLLILTTAMAVANSAANLGLLNISSAITGLAFGGMQGLVPAVTSELFGLENFATNYAIIMLGPAAGSYTMATVLAGAMYDRVMRWQHQKGGDCMGPDCFRYTFLIAATLSAFGTVLAALLWRRTSKKYQKIIKVMMAERNRRGIKAEMEESREILEAYVEENKTLVALLARGRALVQTLQQNSTDAAKPDSPLMQAVSELTGLVGEANSLLATSTQLEAKYLALPSYAERRNSMQLLEDTQAPTTPSDLVVTQGAPHRLMQSRTRRVDWSSVENV